MGSCPKGWGSPNAPGTKAENAFVSSHHVFPGGLAHALEFYRPLQTEYPWTL